MPTAQEPVDRPWGSYQVVETDERFQVKRITVSPGRRLSYQRHEHRAEHWFVVQGTGLVTLDGEERPLRAGDAVDVAIGAAHRIGNTGEDDLVFVEVQTGHSFAEDDIVRLDDDFGRAG